MSRTRIAATLCSTMGITLVTAVVAATPFATAALETGQLDTGGSLTPPAAAAPAAEDGSGADPVKAARERIANVAREMAKDAEDVRKDLSEDTVPEADVAVDLMRYATYRVAGTFFTAWSEDPKLARPDKPKCFVEDSAPETSIAIQLSNDEFLISFVQEGHLFEVASGLADEICKTFGPQIIRPMVKQAEDGIPPVVETAPPPKQDAKKKK